LSLGNQAKMAIVEDTPVEDIIRKMNGLGVNYDSYQIGCLRKCKRVQESFNAWKASDFSSMVLDGKAFPIGRAIAPENSPSEMVADDKKILQNYGRPYNEGGQPSGTYYKYAKTAAIAFFQQ
jgi:hypothetical protein